MSRSDTAADRNATVAALRNILSTTRDGLNYALEREGLEVVIFEWSTEHGQCRDCGLPAAYRLVNIAIDGGDFLLCSVDAAYHAAHGDEIEFLNEEEENGA